MSNDRTRYASYTTRNLMYPDDKEVEGKKRKMDYIDWILVSSAFGWVVVITLWLLGTFFPAN